MGAVLLTLTVLSIASDPISDDEKRNLREAAFGQQFPSLNNIFSSLVNGDSRLFENSLLFYIDITFRLCNS